MEKLDFILNKNKVDYKVKKEKNSKESLQVFNNSLIVRKKNGTYYIPTNLVKFQEEIGKLTMENGKIYFVNEDKKIQIEEKDLNLLEFISNKKNKKKILKQANLDEIEKLAIDGLAEYPDYLPFFDFRAKLNILKNKNFFEETRKKIIKGFRKKPTKVTKQAIEKYLELTRNIQGDYITVSEVFEKWDTPNFFAIKPCLMAITGLNGSGKTTFAIYLANYIANDLQKRVGYILNEDFTITKKIRKELPIDFFTPSSISEIYFFLEMYDIVIIDSFSNLDYLNSNYGDNNNFFKALTKNIYQLTHSRKSLVILISHLTKQAREEYSEKNKIPSFFKAYTGPLSIFTDIGVVISKKNSEIIVDYQKNRFTKNYLRYCLNFDEIYNEVMEESETQV